MKRYRWLKAHWPLSMRALAKRLKAMSFEDASSAGFVIDRVRDTYIEARYIERMEYDEKITDPFGKELSFHRVEYMQCEFLASVEGPGLELIDAPRSIQAMISRLTEATNFGLAISPLEVNVVAWAEDMQRSLKVDGAVNSLQIGELKLTPNVTAKILVRGEKSVLEASDALIKGKKHTIEKVQVQIPSKHKTVVILSQNGTARIDSDVPNEVLPSIRSALIEQMSR